HPMSSFMNDGHISARRTVRPRVVGVNGQVPRAPYPDDRAAIRSNIAGADKTSAQVTTLIPDLWLCPPIAPLSSRGQRRAAS
ncbi:hypothetical protein ACFVZL_42645, partial [Streptomyces sp. NPDC058320]|uniref:hypothetical protein n=1 Tax=unclassified Streptomyces TaxID=2593676 RepID=UPI003634407B